MEDYLVYLTIGIILILFFYFGYRDDFKRNPKEFKRTIIGVLVGILSLAFGFFGMVGSMIKWIKSDKDES